MSDIFTFLLGGGTFSIIVIYIFKNPEKVEKWSSMIYYTLSKFWKYAEKKYITSDIQGRVNNYVINFLKKEIKDFQPVKLKLEWINVEQTPESFSNNNKFVIRMHPGKDQDKNFVNAAYIFISENLLIQAKRYISKTQSESINLFTAKKLFEREKQTTMVKFLDEYLIDALEDDKLEEMIKKHNNIDSSGLFFPVFIQEMTFLGQKVFFERKDAKVYSEVTELIKFLNKFANRFVRDENENNFWGEYCRFGITIIGTNFKINNEGESPYQKYVKKIAEKGVETIYIIGKKDNKSFIKNDVCTKELLKELGYTNFHERNYKAKIRVGNAQDHEERIVENYLLILRKNKPNNFFS